MTSSVSGPLLKAAGLWERTSAKGNRYLLGRLNGLKVLILQNREREGEGDPTHFLFFGEAAERPRPAAQEDVQVSPQPAKQRPGRRRAPIQRSGAADSDADPNRPFFSDPIPF